MSINYILMFSKRKRIHVKPFIWGGADLSLSLPSQTDLTICRNKYGIMLYAISQLNSPTHSDGDNMEIVAHDFSFPILFSFFFHFPPFSSLLFFILRMKVFDRIHLMRCIPCIRTDCGKYSVMISKCMHLCVTHGVCMWKAHA